MRHRVAIVGGGFGGLSTARGLRSAPVDVTLLDRRNHHLFQPLLYQVATGMLSPANIAAPLRSLVKNQADTTVLLSEVVDIDVSARQLVLEKGHLAYDTLVLATGASHSYFGHPEWELHAPGLKTVDDATEIRRRVLLAFEMAERSEDLEQVERWLTIVIVGGGPTGVELAGAIAEIARHTLPAEYRHIDSATARIFLLEGAERILGAYPEKLSQKAHRALEKLGVTVLTKAMVNEVQAHRVSYRIGDVDYHLHTNTTLWAAGVQASPLGAVLAKNAGLPLQRAGRLKVEPDLTLPGHPEIFVIGDLAEFSHQTGSPLPALAPVAQQQGRHVAKTIKARVSGRQLPAQFQYFDRGTMATVGRLQAIADLRGLHLSGAIAWFAWLLVHLMAIVQFANRVLILIQWAWAYMTWNRSARLITGPPHYRSPDLADDRLISRRTQTGNATLNPGQD